MGHQSKITAKGQTTIPIEVREHLRLQPGDKVAYIFEPGAVRIVPKNRRAVDLFGLLGTPPAGSGATIKDFDEAIGRALAEDDERITREWNEKFGRQG